MTSTMIATYRPAVSPVDTPLPFAAVRPAPVAARRPWRFLAAGAVVAGLGVAATQHERLPRFFPPAPPPSAAPEPAARSVTVVAPTVATAPTELTLPAQLLPNEQTDLYARVDGYVARWLADRGTRVKAGQLLAEIDAPELDQQVRQAEAALAQGRAALEQFRADRDQADADADAAAAQVKVADADAALAGQELERSATVVRGGAGSRTDYDTAVRNRDAAAARVAAADADAAARRKTVVSRDAAIVTQEATVRGLEAALGRLTELQKFKRIVAPINGTVTRRYAEVGMLVTANAGSPLFHVQDSSTLRVQVDVPQRYADAARRATAGDLLVPEFPGRPLPAKLARTANALDPTTRTLRVELDLPNPDRAVLAGTFARVRLSVPGSRPAVAVPVAAVRYTPAGVQVAVVAGDRVELRPVALGRDYGRAVEVTGGLDGTEKLVVNPADDLRTGEPVRVAGEQPADARAAALAAAWPAAE